MGQRLDNSSNVVDRKSWSDRVKNAIVVIDATCAGYDTAGWLWMRKRGVHIAYCVLMSTRNLSLTFDWPIPESVFLRYCLKVALKQLDGQQQNWIENIYMILMKLSPFVYSYVSYIRTLTDEVTCRDFPQDVKYFLLLTTIVQLNSFETN